MLKKILIIEDDQTIRSFIRDLLEENLFEVYSASDGKEGLQLVKKILPDLIICDILMPKLDGYKLFDILKIEPLYASIPFIFLTAKAELDDFRLGMQMGADDYIFKPFRANDLLKAVEIRLERFQAIQNKGAQELDNHSDTKNHLLGENDRIFVNEKNNSNIIRVGDILWIKAEGEYSTIFTISGTKFLIRKLMKHWETQLSDNLFMRIHRSTIINIYYIKKIEKWSNRSLIILLNHTDEKFIVSQRFSKQIKAKFLM